MIQLGATVVIVMAYLCVAGVVGWLVHKRPDLGSSRMLMIFASFLALCAAGRLISVLAIVESAGWLADFGAAVVALAALAITLFVFRLLPDLLKLPSRAKLAEVIFQLEHEIVERRTAEEALRVAHTDLESRVQARTAELYNRNRELYSEIIDHNRVEAVLRETQLVLSSAQRLALSNACFNRAKISSELLALLA